MDTDRFNRLLDKATELFNAGFTSKAGQKAALDNLNRAYDLQKEAIHNILLTEAREDRGENWNSLYWGIPDLHNWKAKHSEMFKTFVLQVSAIEQLVELRTAIKGAVIVPPAKDETKVITAAVRKSMIEIMEKRQADFAYGCKLHDIFGKLPVSVNAHWVRNSHGTEFIRYFFYLNGHLTALNVIIAIMQEKEPIAA